MEVKPYVDTVQNTGYKKIKDDMIKQMGSLQRKRKSEIASENMRLFKKI